MFPTVPGSSINSWDSWFIFNLRKINTCYCTTQCVHWKRWHRWYEKVRVHTSNNVNLKCWSSSNACNKVEFLFTIMHTFWAMYILGLRSSWGTSPPSWSSSEHLLTPALSPFRGACVRSHACPEKVVYSLNDSCSHFTQRLFPPNVP
jgi:hypothetical protein